MYPRFQLSGRVFSLDVPLIATKKKLGLTNLKGEEVVLGQHLHMYNKMSRLSQSLGLEVVLSSP